MPETVPETNPVTETHADEDEPLRWYVIAAYVVAVVAGFAAAVLLTVRWAAGCSKIDDGLSDVAGDSTYAGLCESGHGAAALLVPGGWVLGLVLATVGLMRWAGGLRGTVLLVVVLLTPVALPAVVFTGMRSTSTTCGDDDLAAYQAWADQGSQGSPPSDCRTF